MKKILLFICFAFACQMAFSQSQEKKKKAQQMFGVAVALNYAKIVGEHEENDPLWGGQAGVYLAIWKAERAMLTTYLLYSMMGTKFSDDSKYRLNYLVLPFLFQYMLAANLYLGAGLQPGILLSAKYKLDDQSIDAKDNLKTFDLGIPVQLSYDLNKSLSLGLNVTPGITKINETGTGSARNFGAGLRVTYRF